MIYPQRDDKRKKKKVLFTLAGLSAFAVLVGLLAFFAPHLFSPAMQSAEKPASSIRTFLSAAIGNTFAAVRSKRGLDDENRHLKEKVVFLDSVVIERDMYKKENEEIRALLGRVAESRKVVLGRIISKPGFSPYDTMIIDIGEQAGIEQGSRVLADEAVALGWVSAVYARTSTVVFYSSPEERTEVFIGDKAIQSVVVGKGGGNFEIKLPRNSGVALDDMVTLARDPRLVLGTVGVIHVEPTDSYERVLFKSAVDVGDLKFVLVEKQ